MARRSCPNCARRLPYAGRRCRHCGWVALQGLEVPRRSRRRIGAWTIALAALLLAVGGYLYENASNVADWYATFAWQHLPAGASSFAPAPSGSGAYFYCARQVVKRIEGDLAVQTFPAPEEGETAALGNSRYRIRAYVDQAGRNGDRARFDFTCAVHYDGGRWVLEKLEVERRGAAVKPEG